uniref:Rab-GAP TBC domain-containing protein n=1 Tax=Phakopsora pachyrhizi TaxID=170000 RepID=A0A0S1MKH8_PHAPC
MCLNQIECDVTRTLPTNVYFGGDGPGVSKLRRVLAAMSWHNPRVGYCQGMNMVAATLLLTIPSEEDAFWVLVCIVDKILPPDYYTSHLLTSQADQRVLRDLVEKYLPDLWCHFDSLEVELPAITFGWFLSLFADALPIQTLLRVFDLFLIDGCLLLFRVALALLKLNKSTILSHDSPASLYAYMRGPMTLSSHHADRIIDVATEQFKEVKNKQIATLREKHVADLKAEMGIE